MKFDLYYKLQKKAELLIINDDMDEHFCEASKFLPDPHINNVVVVVEDNIPYFFSLMYYEMIRKKLWHDVYVMEWYFVLYSPKTKSYPFHTVSIDKN